jgi:hypothetical protein
MHPLMDPREKSSSSRAALGALFFFSPPPPRHKRCDGDGAAGMRHSRQAERYASDERVPLCAKSALCAISICRYLFTPAAFTSNNLMTVEIICLPHIRIARDAFYGERLSSLEEIKTELECVCRYADTPRDEKLHPLAWLSFCEIVCVEY